MNTLEKNIKEYLEKNHIKDNVSYFYYNTCSKETYLYRESEIYLAASTIKVPVVMAWIDLIEKGVVNKNTQFQYLERHYEESDEKALYDTYSFNDYVPLSEMMELAIVYSDNPSNHMMREYYKNYSNETFREWFAHFSKEQMKPDFYVKNQMNASIMLEVMKTLYDHKVKYNELIDYMKIAAKGRYIQANHFDFEVAQKYGEYDKYEHTMAILYTKEPLLVGIFTECANENAKKIIQDISKIMVRYFYEK